MNEKDIIINALCRTIKEKEKYIKELEDAIVYQKQEMRKLQEDKRC